MHDSIVKRRTPPSVWPCLMFAGLLALLACSADPAQTASPTLAPASRLPQIPPQTGLLVITRPHAALRTVLRHPGIALFARSTAVAGALHSTGNPPDAAAGWVQTAAAWVDAQTPWPRSIAIAVHLGDALAFVQTGDFPALHVRLTMASAADAKTLHARLQDGLSQPGDHPLFTALKPHAAALTARLDGTTVHLHSKAMSLPPPVVGDSPRVIAKVHEPPAPLDAMLPTLQRGGFEFDLRLQGDRATGHLIGAVPQHSAIAADSVLRAHVPEAATAVSWQDASRWNDLGQGAIRLADTTLQRIAQAVADGHLGAVLTTARADEAPIIFKVQTLTKDWLELPAISLPIVWVVASADAEIAADLVAAMVNDIAGQFGLTVDVFDRQDGRRQLDLARLTMPPLKALKIEGDLQLVLDPTPGALFISLNAGWAKQVSATHPVTDTRVAHRFGYAKAGSFDIFARRMARIANLTAGSTGNPHTTMSALASLPALLDDTRWQSTQLPDGRLRIEFESGLAAKPPFKPHVARTLPFDWLPRVCGYEPFSRKPPVDKAFVAVPGARNDTAPIGDRQIEIDAEGLGVPGRNDRLAADATRDQFKTWITALWPAVTPASVIALAVTPQESGARLQRVISHLQHAGYRRVGIYFRDPVDRFAPPDVKGYQALRARMDATEDSGRRQQMLADAMQASMRRCPGLSAGFQAMSNFMVSPAERCAQSVEKLLATAPNCPADSQAQLGTLLRFFLPADVPHLAVFELVNQGGLRIDPQATWGEQGPALIRAAQRRISVAAP